MLALTWTRGRHAGAPGGLRRQCLAWLGRYLAVTAQRQGIVSSRSPPLFSRSWRTVEPSDPRRSLSQICKRAPARARVSQPMHRHSLARHHAEISVLSWHLASTHLIVLISGTKPKSERLQSRPRSTTAPEVGIADNRALELKTVLQLFASDLSQYSRQ